MTRAEFEQRFADLQARFIQAKRIRLKMQDLAERLDYQFSYIEGELAELWVWWQEHLPGDDDTGE
jgi:hypothetical protein